MSETIELTIWPRCPWDGNPCNDPACGFVDNAGAFVTFACHGPAVSFPQQVVLRTARLRWQFGWDLPSDAPASVAL